MLVLSCLFGALAFSLVQLIPDNYLEYQDAQSKVNSYIRDQDSVMGQQWFWFGLHTHKYYSWEFLFLYPRLYPGKSVSNAFEYYHPNI